MTDTQKLCLRSSIVDMLHPIENSIEYGEKIKAIGFDNVVERCMKFAVDSGKYERPHQDYLTIANLISDVLNEPV